MNEPLPSSKNSHFQTEAKNTPFLVKMSFICKKMALRSVLLWDNSEMAYLNSTTGPESLTNCLIWKSPVWAQGPVAAFRVKTLLHFLYLISNAFLSVTLCVNITVSQRRGSIVFCKHELHILRQENPARNLA